MRIAGRKVTLKSVAIYAIVIAVTLIMPATFNFSLGMFAVAFGVHRAAVLVLDLPEAMRPHRHFKNN